MLILAPNSIDLKTVRVAETPTSKCSGGSSWPDRQGLCKLSVISRGSVIMFRRETELRLENRGAGFTS